MCCFSLQSPYNLVHLLQRSTTFGRLRSPRISVHLIIHKVAVLGSTAPFWSASCRNFRHVWCCEMVSVLIAVLLRTHGCCTLTSPDRQRVIGSHPPSFEFVPPRVHLLLPLDSTVHHYCCSTNSVSFMSSDRKYRARDWCSLMHFISAAVLVASQYSHYSVHKWKLTAYKFRCSRNILRCFHKHFESEHPGLRIYSCRIRGKSYPTAIPKIVLLEGRPRSLSGIQPRVLLRMNKWPTLQEWAAVCYIWLSLWCARPRSYCRPKLKTLPITQFRWKYPAVF